MSTTLEARQQGITPRFSGDFNICVRYGETLLQRESHVRFDLGDWWLYMQTQFADRIDAIRRIKDEHPRLEEYARVARAFPQVESDTLRFSLGRIPDLNWAHHRACAAIVDETERMVWLTDALRHGWGANRLEAEIAQAKREQLDETAPRPPSLTYRAVGDLYQLATREAANHGVTPAEWLEQGIRYLASHGSPHLRELEAA
jgi:hypothetical protein